MPNTSEIASMIIERVNQIPNAYLIGIAGLPGSGKTTLCEMIRRQYPQSAIISMDGYHIPRSRLSESQLLRRGAPDTFDKNAFRDSLESLKLNRVGSFPTFDHSEKDPRPHSQFITNENRPVFVEGLYLLMQDWNVWPLLDFKIFLECKQEQAVERLASRHFQSGLVATVAEGRKRAIENDMQNASTIINDGCSSRADLVIDNSA